MFPIGFLSLSVLPPCSPLHITPCCPHLSSHPFLLFFYHLLFPLLPSLLLFLLLSFTLSLSLPSPPSPPSPLLLSPSLFPFPSPPLPFPPPPPYLPSSPLPLLPFPTSPSLPYLPSSPLLPSLLPLLLLPPSPLLTQILAVYNTLGNVIRGHPTKLTDVIDYVVFERPLTKTDSQWRIAAKLPPQRPLKTARSEPKGQKALTA